MLQVNGVDATGSQIIQIRQDLQVNTLAETQIQLDGRYVRTVNGNTPVNGDVSVSLSDAADILFTNPVVGQVVKFDGTRWINADETGAPSGGGSGVTDGSKGDITVSGSGSIFTINPNVVSLSKLTTIGAGTILGNNTASASVPAALTSFQLSGMLPLVSLGTKGLVPALPGGTTSFLRADGTWASPVSGSSSADGGAAASVFGPVTGVDGGSASTIF